MIPPQNPFYRRALARPHEAYSRVEVWRSGVQLGELAAAGLDDRVAKPYTRRQPVFFDGFVRATLASQVTRQLQLTVPDDLYPWNATDLLNPYGNELRAFRGIRYGNGTPDEFPVFVGKIIRARPPGKGSCVIEAMDNSQRVSGSGFVAPRPSQVGDLVLDEFERLVLDQYPAAQFGAHSAITTRVPALSYDNTPGSALDLLAKAAAALWYVLADGRFVMRYIPWVQAPAVQPLALADGIGGTLSTAFPNRDAADLFNRVTAISDRTDGGPAYWATADDSDPNSPTYVGGPFGVKAMQLRVTGAVVQDQLLQIAKAQVQRTKARIESWAITCVPDASIELGDLVAPTYRGHTSLQVVSSFNMPLNPRSEMAIEGRAINSGTGDE